MTVEEAAKNRFHIKCGHNGYAGLKGKNGPLHWRQWNLENNRLDIKDEFTSLAGNGFQIAVYYHLYPGARVDLEKHKIHLKNLCITFDTDADMRVEETRFHPEFGKSVPNLCLVLKPNGTACSITFIFEE